MKIVFTHIVDEENHPICDEPLNPKIPSIQFDAAHRQPLGDLIRDYPCCLKCMMIMKRYKVHMAERYGHFDALAYAKDEVRDEIAVVPLHPRPQGG